MRKKIRKRCRSNWHNSAESLAHILLKTLYENAVVYIFLILSKHCLFLCIMSEILLKATFHLMSK